MESRNSDSIRERIEEGDRRMEIVAKHVKFLRDALHGVRNEQVSRKTKEQRIKEIKRNIREVEMIAFVSIDENDAVGKIRRRLAHFLGQEHPIPSVLNVAGPRESKAVGIQKSTRRLLIEALQDMITGKHADVD